MFSDHLKPGLSATFWKPDIIQTILDTTKSKYDRRFAALFALMMAQSKEYESERFLYFWMAMNALYGYMAEIHMEKNGKQLRKEAAQIRLISCFYNTSYYSQNDRNKNNELLN